MALLGQSDWTVVCFLGTQCPLAKLYGPRLQRMADDFAENGIRFIGVNSNVQDSRDEVREYAKKHSIRFPIVKDYDRTVALNFKATRTPEVVVVDQAGNIRYRGRIDDQYLPGIARSQATKNDLRDALEQLVSDKPVANPMTKPVGCLIALPKSFDNQNLSVTYCNQVSRILQRHCVECHRAGEIGPFALDEYEEVVGWADMMVEVIDQKRMPPWHASSEHGQFANAREMPESDKQLVRTWVKNGSPYGDADQLPEPATFLSGWRLGQEPDLVLK